MKESDKKKIGEAYLRLHSHNENEGMTNEEAIKILKQFRDRQGNSSDDNEALDLAIKALEIQPCEDCISREDTLNKINALIAEYIPLMPIGWTLPLNIAKTINELPSVTPKAESCEDAISRQAVHDIWHTTNPTVRIGNEEIQYKKIAYNLPSVTPQQTRWIPVSERLPKAFEFVDCTCHSLIDDREDWVIETVYIPQPSDSPYSDWGNIPMLNVGDCKVVAWMHRDIPEPYKAESEENNDDD